MSTPAELAAATAAALQAEAVNDLGVLQAGLAVVTNPQSTVGACAAAIQAMVAGLADADRIEAVKGLSDGWASLVGGLQTEISKANAAAGN